MRKRLIEIVVLVSLALGAGPAGAALWQWSQTSSLNATSDPGINWSEGQAPSSINDSARAMMSAVARYRDDISGLLATGGSSTAYTVTTNQGLSTTPNDGQLLSVTVHATNGVAPTLVADGGTAFPIQSSPGVPVASGSLILGSPYSMKYSTANSAWMLKGFYSSVTNVPLGALVPFTLTTSPNSNFVFAAGQCLSTTTYATYWVAVGSPASGSCPGGQFAIIDLSGRVPAGMDTMPGFSAKNRLTAGGSCGTAMTTVGASCANGSQGHIIDQVNLPAVSIPTSTNVTSREIGTLAGGGASIALDRLQIAGGGGTQTQAFPGTTSALGSGTTLPTVDPNVAVAYLLRVL